MDVYICGMKKILLLVAAFFAVYSCKNENPSAAINLKSTKEATGTVATKQLTASDIITQAIQSHGADLLANSVMEFSFRKVRYKVTRSNGVYNYSRSYVKGADSIQEILSNNGVAQMKGGKISDLSKKELTTISSSINSVVYFAQLPFSLDGTAVHHELVGTTTLKGKNYFKIKVTFSPDGGGEDFEDIFLYWIDMQDFVIDYLAYSYCEEDCGVRFRESVNRRVINGVIVQDYINYKSNSNNLDLETLDEQFLRGDLSQVSTIKTEAPIVETKGTF